MFYAQSFLFLFLLIPSLARSVMEEVVLLDHPVSGYIIKSKPYHLSCKALNAKKIQFKCRNRWLDESRYETVLGTDPASQLPYLETSVEINRQEIDSSVHLEDFICQCYASGTSDSVIRSDPAKIRVSYMRKHFIQSPTSESVLEGSTVQLPCVAPESDPKANIVWLKNGEEIHRSSDSNIIYGSDGSLIVSSARLLDSGNYSCEATNPANKRATDPVALNVYVNGGWSEWSAFSGLCQMDCNQLRLMIAQAPTQDVLPKLRRTRTCNNPPPLNGGAYCIGEDEDQQVCDIKCKIDGRWSPWSDWSACSPSSCHKFRSRTCTAPSPLNKGLPCTGRDMETATCEDRFCQPVSTALSSDTALYGGLACVSLLLLVIIGLCMALLCRRTKSKKNINNNIYYADSAGQVRRVLLDDKSVVMDEECNKIRGSQFFTLASTCSPSPLHPSMTLRSAKSGYSSYSTQRNNVGSRAALITECSSSNSSSGCGKLALMRSSSCSDDDNYATLYDFMEEKSVESLESSQSVLAAQVDQNGARLQLRKSGAMLLIPEGSIDGERMIYLAVSDQLADRPKLNPSQTALSPVILIGECENENSEGSNFLLKPLVVSFKHCASTFPRDNWIFSLYADQGFGWNEVVTLGEEDLNTTMHVYMETSGDEDRIGWCHVMTEHFTRLMLVGRSRRPSISPLKRVHLAAYGPVDRPQGPFDLRVYCVPETGAAMESVSRQEERGRLLAESNEFLLNERGELCVCVEDIIPGYNVTGPSFIEIPDSHHLWCAQNGLHCSFTITPVDQKSAKLIDNFAARLVVYQKTGSAERHLLHVRFENDIYDKPESASEDKIVTVDFQLPVDIKEELAQMLDIPCQNERDWRALAKKLRFDRILKYFGTRPGCSPTLLLLDLWEASNVGSRRAVHDLLQNLRVMGRPDAVLLIEQYLARFSYILSP